MARDADTPHATRTEVAPSLTAELIFAANLAASANLERSRVGPDWVVRQRAALPPSIQEDLPRFAGYWWPTMGLVDFLCWNGHFQDPEAFVEAVREEPITRFLSILLNDDVTPAQAAALIADAALVRDMADRLSQFSTARTEDLERLFREPEEHREALLALVAASNTPLFRETFEALVTEAAPTVQTLERRLTTEDAVAVAESLREKPLRGPRSYGRVTFVPSRLIGHRHIQSWGNDSAVFFFQLGAAPLTGPTETGAELAEFLKVLSDRTRMDILRLLCCGPSYGKEIAASLGLTTATVSRHLDQLKAAGLVREERADSNNVKRLRYVPESLDVQFDRLKTYLLHT